MNLENTLRILATNTSQKIAQLEVDKALLQSELEEAHKKIKDLEAEPGEENI